MSDESDKLKQYFQDHPTQVRHIALRDDLHKLGVIFGNLITDDSNQIVKNDCVLGIARDKTLDDVIQAVEAYSPGERLNGSRLKQYNSLLEALRAAERAIYPDETVTVEADAPESHAQPEAAAAEPVAEAERPNEGETLEGAKHDEVISETATPKETVTEDKTEEKQADSASPNTDVSDKAEKARFVDKLRGKANELLHGDRKKLAIVGAGVLVAVGIVAKLAGGKDQTVAGQKLPTPNNQNQNQDRGVA